MTDAQVILLCYRTLLKLPYVDDKLFILSCKLLSKKKSFFLMREREREREKEKMHPWKKVLWQKKLVSAVNSAANWTRVYLGVCSIPRWKDIIN